MRESIDEAQQYLGFKIVDSVMHPQHELYRVVRQGVLFLGLYAYKHFTSNSKVHKTTIN